MTDLKFGINLLPHQWEDVVRVEELGYDSAWTSEHIFFYFPTFDVLTSLAAMAARTERITLGTAVMLLPLRPAALAAKEIASVDIISSGRLILGIGVGGEFPKEFEAVGVPVSERGARTTEALDVIKKLYNEDQVTYDGRFTKLDGVTLMPKPTQPGGPPMWVAGRSEAAMKRAGRLADGYMPYLFSPDRFRDGLAKARDYAEQAGRDPSSIKGAIYQFVALADTYDEAKVIAAKELQMRYQQPFENLVDKYAVMGTADDCVSRLAQYAEAGVEHFILVPLASSYGDYMTHVETYASDIIPKLRT
jgi:probable F420-dependent oxidoreductase